MATLVYIANGLQSPELDIMLARVQSEIHAGRTPFVAYYPENAGYASAFNPYGSHFIYAYGRERLEHGLAAIEGDFNRIELPAINEPLSPSEFSAITADKYALKNYYYKDVDCGQAALASYLSLIRDQDLEGFLARKTLRPLLETSRTITRWLHEFIPAHDIDTIIVYGARLNDGKPFLGVGNALKLKVEVMEFCGNHHGCVWESRNILPQDIDDLGAKMNANWDNFDGTREEKAKEFFAMKIAGGNMTDKSYVTKHKAGKLPDNWKMQQHNIVIFNSSEDEFSAMGGAYDDTLYPSQLIAISKICESLQEDISIHLYLRMHPNLAKVNWTFAQNLRKLGEKFDNITVIAPESPISTYALMNACDTSVTFGSTITFESAAVDKPTILLGRCVHELMGFAYVPKTHGDVVALLQNKALKPLPKEGAYKMALFFGWGGHEIPHFTGTRQGGFFINGQHITTRPLSRKLYLFSKGLGVIRTKYSCWRKQPKSASEQAIS